MFPAARPRARRARVPRARAEAHEARRRLAIRDRPAIQTGDNCTGRSRSVQPGGHVTDTRRSLAGSPARSRATAAAAAADAAAAVGKDASARTLKTAVAPVGVEAGRRGSAPAQIGAPILRCFSRLRSWQRAPGAGSTRPACARRSPPRGDAGRTRDARPWRAPQFGLVCFPRRACTRDARPREPRVPSASHVTESATGAGNRTIVQAAPTAAGLAAKALPGMYVCFLIL